jgi:hypothetical protein
MGALTSLNLSSNDLKAEGAKIVAETIKVANCAIVVVWYCFHAYLTTGQTAVVYCYPQDNGVLTQLDVSSNNLTRGKWTNAWGDGDRDDRRNFGTDMTGFFALADGILDSGGLSLLDLTDNMLGGLDMASIICVLKEHAIQHHRACACLVGYEFMTKDLRALLVATYNLDPRCWLLTIRIEQLCKDIASWL